MLKAETFRAAAKIIRRQQKLPRHHLHDPDGNYCVMGAVLKVMGIDTTQDWNDELENLPEIRFLALVLNEFYPRYQNISNWSDKRGRTPLEAVKLLQAAAEFSEFCENLTRIDEQQKPAN